MSATRPASLDAIVERFEQAWLHGEPPAIEEFLHGLADAPALLIELVHTDMEYRLKRGLLARAQDYVVRFPELASQAKAVVDLLAAEAVLRRRHERGFDVQALLGPQAQYREQVLAKLASLGQPGLADVVHDTGSSADDQTGGMPPAGGNHGLEFLAKAQAADEIGRLGHFRVLKELGRGGMGCVLLAEDTKLQRHVALKLMLPRFAKDSHARERFLREARSAAKIHHDNVITIFQVDEWQQVPFIAMELLQGTSLDTLLREKRSLPLASAVRIARDMAEGLAAAHRQGLVHRDIKPGNVWLEAPQERVKILDFGLARAHNDSHLTQEGAIVGTPAFMAPEQAGSGAVDARCDLFSLGVVLYRLTTGRQPFAGPTALATLTAIAVQTPVPPRELNANIPESLEKVMMKLLEKAPAKRHGSAQEAAGELNRVLQELAEEANEQTSVNPWQSYEAKAKQPASRPPRRLLWLGGAAVLGVAIGAAVLWQLASRPGANKDGKDPNKPGVSRPELAELLPPTPASALDQLLPEKIAPYERKVAGGASEPLPKELVAVLGDSRLMHWRSVQSLGYDTEGKRLVSAGLDDNIKVWDAQTGQELLHIRAEHRGVSSAAISPDGKSLASCGADGTVKIWDSATGKLSQVCRGHTRDKENNYQNVNRVGFSPDSKRLVSGGYDGTVRVWEVASGKEMLSIEAHEKSVRNVAFSPDGTRIFSAGRDLVARVWDAATGKEVLAIKDYSTVAGTVMAFSPDGKRFVAVAGDTPATVKIWDAADGKELQTIAADARRGIGISPDGKRLALVAFNGTQIWDLASGKGIFQLQSYLPVFSPDSKHVAAVVDGYNRVGIWNASTRKNIVPVWKYACAVDRVAISPDASSIATTSDSWTVLWNVSKLQVVNALPSSIGGHNRGLGFGLTFSPDGKSLVIGNFATLQVLSLSDPRKTHSWKAHEQRIAALAYSHDGKYLASGNVNRDRTVKIWKSTGELIRTLEGHSDSVLCVAFSPDSKRLASGSLDKTIKLWDVDSGKELASWERGRPPQNLVFSPDGKHLASSAWYRNTVVMDSVTGEQVHEIKSSGSNIDLMGVAYSPNGKVLASSSQDGSLTLYETATWQPVRQWRFLGSINSLIFAADGRHLITGNGNGTVYVLRLTPALKQDPKAHAGK